MEIRLLTIGHSSCSLKVQYASTIPITPVVHSDSKCFLKQPLFKLISYLLFASFEDTEKLFALPFLFSYCFFVRSAFKIL